MTKLGQENTNTLQSHCRNQCVNISKSPDKMMMIVHLLAHSVLLTKDLQYDGSAQVFIFPCVTGIEENKPFNACKSRNKNEIDVELNEKKEKTRFNVFIIKIYGLTNYLA